MGLRDRTFAASGEIPVKINFKGGLVSPADLRTVVNAAMHAGTDVVRIGERQNLWVEVKEGRLKSFCSTLAGKGLETETGTDVRYPNLMSSYAADGIYDETHWLSEGIYQDALNSFTHSSVLKISIIDSRQALVPLYSSHLNFIASPTPNFWYLYYRLPGRAHLESWPELIYNQNLGNVALSIEIAWRDDNNITPQQLPEEVKKKNVRLIVSEKTGELTTDRVRFPYYEGMNKLTGGYWCGIYKRVNDYPAAFLESLTHLCTAGKIGKIYLTPWKTLIVKGIKEEDRIKWETLLGRYGINLRHNAIELNWQIGDFDKHGIRLKSFVYQEFDKRDIRTYGLSFSVLSPDMSPAASIIIEKVNLIRLGPIQLLPVYNIWHTENFDPNSQKRILYAAEVVKKDLPDRLVTLSKYYYEGLMGAMEKLNEKQKVKEKKSDLPGRSLLQCRSCYTVYDEAAGEPFRNIVPGTPFAKLPADWCCSVCDAPKSDYAVPAVSAQAILAE